MRIAGTVSESIVDGPGLRLTVFTQGCPHRCPGCHNPQTHDPAGGREETTTALLARYTADPLLDGLTLSGGEPMEQAAECAALAEAVHALGGNVWVYTGWRYEALVQESDPARLRLLAAADVLVDGPYVEAELIDGVTIDRRRFYERLIESDVLPTTSQATPAAFVKEFEAVRQAGESAVVITISAELSGTYQSACIAAADYEDIYVVDSRSAAIGSGILAELALEWAADGMAAAELAGLLTKKRDDICLLGLLDTLEYLRRGGRISRTAALAGGLLGIKPVVTLENGAVTMIGKARGSKQGNNLLVQKVRESGGIDFSLPILLGYTGLSDALLQKYVADSAALWRDLPRNGLCRNRTVRPAIVILRRKCRIVCASICS